MSHDFATTQYLKLTITVQSIVNLTFHRAMAIKCLTMFYLSFTLKVQSSPSSASSPTVFIPHAPYSLNHLSPAHHSLKALTPPLSWIGWGKNMLYFKSTSLSNTVSNNSVISPEQSARARKISSFASLLFVALYIRHSCDGETNVILTQVSSFSRRRREKAPRERL